MGCRNYIILDIIGFTASIGISGNPIKPFQEVLNTLKPLHELLARTAGSSGLRSKGQSQTLVTSLPSTERYGRFPPERRCCQHVLRLSRLACLKHHEAYSWCIESYHVPFAYWNPRMLCLTTCQVAVPHLEIHIDHQIVQSIRGINVHIQLQLLVQVECPHQHLCLKQVSRGSSFMVNTPTLFPLDQPWCLGQSHQISYKLQR